MPLVQISTDMPVIRINFFPLLITFVDMKTEMTIPFPIKEIIRNQKTTKARMECHRGFIGGNWYLDKTVILKLSL